MVIMLAFFLTLPSPHLEGGRVFRFNRPTSIVLAVLAGLLFYTWEIQLVAATTMAWIMIGIALPGMVGLMVLFSLQRRTVFEREQLVWEQITQITELGPKSRETAVFVEEETPEGGGEEWLEHYEQAGEEATEKREERKTDDVISPQTVKTNIQMGADIFAENMMAAATTFRQARDRARIDEGTYEPREQERSVEMSDRDSLEAERNELRLERLKLEQQKLAIEEEKLRLEIERKRRKADQLRWSQWKVLLRLWARCIGLSPAPTVSMSLICADPSYQSKWNASSVQRD